MSSKSILHMLSWAALVLRLTSLPLSAGTFGKFTYEDNGTSITITDYPDDATGVVVIPATITAKPVTAIGDYAFEDCTGLTSATIPNSVTAIGYYAFEGCTSLTSASIPNSVTSIGEGAFKDCTGLNSVTIGTGITFIRGDAFSGCAGLSSVFIPNSVTSIGWLAFWGCTGLTSVSIPNSVTSIGENAFSGCSSLTSITVDALNSVYSSMNGVLYDYQKTMLIQYPGGKIGRYSIPNSVTSIEKGAFYDCTGLTSVLIPNSINSIGDYAFLGCSRLIRAVFRGDAPSIGSSESGGIEGIFDRCASGFTVYYPKEKTGFSSPTWHGYPAVAMQLAPEIVVHQPVGSSLVDGSALKKFGTAKVGAVGVTKKFTIKNTGITNLTGLTITKTGSQKSNFIITAPAKTSLEFGATTTFKVTFKPTAKGTRNAVLHIKSNDANESPFDIILTGLGAAP